MSRTVTVTTDAADPLPPGDFVAITIRGRGDWSPEVARRPLQNGDPPLVNTDLRSCSAAAAGAAYCYTRVLASDEGSVTAFFARRVSA